MSSANMNLSLALTGRDNGARRLLQETEQYMQRMAQSRARLARNNRPYAIAGIRSEREIRREIVQTQSAYNRLSRSGRASHNDLSRAAAATRNRIRELNAELNQGIQTQSRFGQGMRVLGKVGTAAVAGGVAAYGVLKPAMDDQKQLQSNMNQVARNAFVADADKSPQWIATQGKAQVKALAEEWVKQSGGTADAALGFMNAQMAQGLNFDEIRRDKGRGYAGMTAMAQNGDYDFDGTASLYSVFKNAGLSGDKISRAVEKTIQSGLDGKFEIADVVREAPALLAGMGKAGMTADKDLDYMLAWMQSAANKAGSNSEAANNLSNTIAKSSSSDLVKKVEKALNVDWKREVLAGQGKGENSVQVLARLLNTNLANNREYQTYAKRAEQGDATAAIQAETIRSMLVSKVMPDLQAQQGLLAAMDVAQMQKYMQSTNGTSNNKIDRINQARMQDLGAQQEQNKALTLLRQDKLMNPLNEMETRFSALTAEFPNTTTALKALAAAATAAAMAQGAMSLLGKGGAAGGAAGGGFLSRVWGGLRGFGGGLANGVRSAGGMVANGAKGAGGWLANGVRSAGGMVTNGAKSLFNAAISNPRLAGAAGMMFYSQKLGDGTLTSMMPKADLERYLMKKSTTHSTTVANNSAQPLEKLTPVITQQTAAYQTAMAAQTTGFQAALQADTAAVGGKLDAINGTLGGLTQTINTNVSLNLDGRTIANEVSRQQVNMFGRGAGQ